MSRILGVVLAGGLSRRMEGPEKSLLALHGTPLISHVVDRFRLQLPDLLINANGDPRRFDFLGLPVQPDTVGDFSGPLAGVLAGMRWATQNGGATHILTAAADTPFFPHDYAKTMSETARDAGAEIAIARSNGRNHPVFGYWPVGLADSLESFLVDENERKVMAFVKRYTHCMVDFNGEEPDPFFNVNTRDDLERAEACIGETP